MSVCLTFVIFLSFLKALLVSSVSRLSPSMHRSLTLAEARQAVTTSLRTSASIQSVVHCVVSVAYVISSGSLYFYLLLVISAAILYLVTTRSSEIFPASASATMMSTGMSDWVENVSEICSGSTRPDERLWRWLAPGDRLGLRRPAQSP